MLVNPLTQSRITQYLEDPAHAVALIAPHGAGKGYIAAHLTQQLLSVNDITDHPYVLSIDVRAQKTGIDEVRNIQKFLSLTVPGKDRIKRVIILESADLLGHEAQNALLKTLEEPPKDTIIIITYANEQLILQTIRSRVSQLHVLPISLEQATAELSFDATSVTKAYHISSGYVGLLCALLHGESDHPITLAITEARELLKMTRYQRLSSVDRIIKNKDIEPIVLIDALYRLLNAGYHNALKSKPTAELKLMMQRLQSIEYALRDLHDNVQTKLVLSRLFLEL